MTDENKGETEVETQDIQEKYDELLEELALKDEELAKVKEDLFTITKTSSRFRKFQKDYRQKKQGTDKIRKRKCYKRVYRLL